MFESSEPCESVCPAISIFMSTHWASTAPIASSSCFDSGLRSALPVSKRILSEVIFPVGYRNRFGHPHPDVLARFASARIHRTDTHGAVRIVRDENGYRAEHVREERRRYWQNTTFETPE